MAIRMHAPAVKSSAEIQEAIQCGFMSIGVHSMHHSMDIMDMTWGSLTPCIAAKIQDNPKVLNVTYPTDGHWKA